MARGRAGDAREPRKVTDVDLAFPADVRAWLPAWEDIPSEFKSPGDPNLANPFVRLAARWFYEGLDADALSDFKVQSGITQDEAIECKRQVQAILGSFEPKHEHKLAGAGLLLSRILEYTPPGTPDADAV